MVNSPLTKCIRRELPYQSLSTRTVKDGFSELEMVFVTQLVC